MTVTRPTQNALVLALLRAAGDEGMSALQLLRLAGCYRAGARIFQLRQQGWTIETIRRQHAVATYILRDRAA